MGWLVLTFSDTEFITPSRWMKFLKVLIHLGSLLKLLVFLLSCKFPDLSIRNLWFVHTILRQSNTNLFVCLVHYVNHLVSQFELFIHGFWLCWYRHWGQVFLPNKSFFAAITSWVLCFSHCKFLKQSELFNVVFLQNLEIYIQVIGFVFWTEKIVRICLGICRNPHSR